MAPKNVKSELVIENETSKAEQISCGTKEEDEKNCGNNNLEIQNICEIKTEENEEKKEKEQRGYILWTQIIAAILVAFVHLGIGTTTALSGVILPQLTDEMTDDLYFPESDAALFSSIVNAGAMIGSLSSSVLMVTFGQRVTLLITLPVSFGSWLALGFSPTVPIAIITRFFIGLINGIQSDCCISYIVEYAHPKVRGKLTAVVDITRQFGYLFVYVIGSTGLIWRNVAFICGTAATITPFIGLLFLPNSPRWLATRRRMGESRLALTFFRGAEYNVEKEMNEIKCEIDQTSGSKNIMGQVRQMFRRSIALRVLLVCFIMFAIPFNGNLVVVSYSASIFESAHTGLNVYMCTILVGLVRVLGVTAFVLFGERLKRRTLFFITFTISALSLIALGCYFYVSHLGYNVSVVSWLPLTCLIIFMFNTGLVSPVLSMFRSELLPNCVRALGLGFSVIALNAGLFIITQTFPFVVDLIGEHGTYWLYGSSGILIVIIAIIVLPETKGKSLEEINAKVVEKSKKKEKQLDEL